MSESPSKESVLGTPLRTLYTESFPALLNELRISLLVSTYQWDQLAILHSDEDGGLAAETRSFFKPMGLAVKKDRLAIGTQGVIQEYRNFPLVAQKIEAESGEPCDAAYLPRTIHATGEIAVHEMEWGGPAGDELFFVNTNFSCICTRSLDYSFIVKWRPKFITDLSATDRCHLNGMCLIDGKPAYATALGETDDERGWRVDKISGGILIDVSSDEIISRNLSMPHSPRWYQNKLWILEAGGGGLGIIDLATGKYEQVVAFPGFSRGFDFHGPYAFVGISLPRNLQIYKGLSVIELPLEKRSCGVWVVDTRTGKIVAFTKFEGGVREIFSVSVLPEYQHPDVVPSDDSILKDSFALPTDLKI